ncbi:MAG: hypothetical protein J0L75_11635 [Spirochaetes bacterium]|nr:hypothetical protein [Spirochaetota bacterium]
MNRHLAPLLALLLLPGFVACTRTASIEIKNKSGAPVHLTFKKTGDATTESFALEDRDSRVFLFEKVTGDFGPEVQIGGSGAYKKAFLKYIQLEVGPGAPRDTFTINADLFNVSYRVSLGSASDAIDRIRFATNLAGNLDVLYGPAAPWTLNFAATNGLPDLFLEAIVKTNIGKVTAAIYLNGVLVDSQTGDGAATASFRQYYYQNGNARPD